MADPASVAGGNIDAIAKSLKNQLVFLVVGGVLIIGPSLLVTVWEMKSTLSKRMIWLGWRLVSDWHWISPESGLYCPFAFE
jgi:hypothetical protein